MNGLRDAYSRSGPYGPLLWHALADFKREFLSLLIRTWSQRDASEQNLLHFCTEWICKHSLECAAELEDASSLKSRLVRTLVENWPVPSEETGRRRLAEHRMVQLSKFLREAAEHLSKAAAAAQDPGSSPVDALLGALGEFVWPYYFVRPGGPFRGGSLITWLPGRKHIRRPIFKHEHHIRHSASGFSGLLYPSIAALLQNTHTEIEETRLAETLEMSFDLGYWPSELSTALNKGPLPNIGHTQGYSPLPNSALAYFDSRILVTAPKSSRFSDAFYLNQEALYVEDVDQESGAVVGRLILCSPIPHLLRHLQPLMGTTPKPACGTEDDDTTIRALANLARRAWADVGGGDIREEISPLMVLQDEEFFEQRKEVLREAFSFVMHSVTGSLVKSYSPPVDVSDRVHATHRLVAIDTRSAMALTGLRTRPILWNTNDYASPGRLIEKALGLPRFAVQIHDEVLDDVDVDPRFVSIVHELARNARRHACTDTHGVVVDIRRHRRKPRIPDAVEVHLETPSTIEDCHGLVGALHAGSRRSGVVFLRSLSKQLAPMNSGSAIRWTFAASDGPATAITECASVYACSHVRKLLHEDNDDLVRLTVSVGPLVPVERW